jgi:ribose transport system ATP-binding protein
MEAAAPIPRLQARCICKAYAVPVLADFDFDLAPGEVHALVGSNGAGKSTFAHILSGLVPADSGTVLLDGRPHAPHTLGDAQARGIVLVQQELNILPTISVAENLFLDRLPHRFGAVQFAVLHAQSRAAMQRVGLGQLDVTAPAGALGVGQRQMVEIARALARQCSVLILDEPTAALTEPEIARLFENIRQLQAGGVGVIYVSHRMDEIRRIADRVTVVRDGRRVATHAASTATVDQLVGEMVGHALPPRAARGPVGTRGAVALEVSNLVAGDRVRGASFSVQGGEILGLAGLIGSGRTETLRAIFGADPATSGGVRLRDRSEPGALQRFTSPAAAVAQGLGLVPEDRRHDGLLLPQSIRVNATLATVPAQAGRLGWLERARERVAAEQACNRLAVRRDSVEQAVSTLSGGNQQKVVIARWLARDCRVLLFDEPTRGIDVSAKETIYAILRALAAEGRALVVVSSDLPELMALCDRIAVMSAGRVAAEFTPDAWSQEAITRAAFSGYLQDDPDAQ